MKIPIEIDASDRKFWLLEKIAKAMISRGVRGGQK